MLHYCNISEAHATLVSEGVSTEQAHFIVQAAKIVAQDDKTYRLKKLWA